ncbi:MAG: hypothetical protein KatS3mg038_3906 [Candidatus Kapaibacterium sp.]|nr:MAG: hypothetical protein KatS3mg038_3906 [Candidatus Kapabacteria bacterium]
MLDAGGDDGALARRAMAAVHARMSDAGVDVSDRDAVHRIATEALGRRVTSLRDLTLDEMRALYRWVNTHASSLSPTSQAVPEPQQEPTQPASPQQPTKTGWSAWIEQHRNHIVLGPVISAIERRHIDADDLCAYIYGHPCPQDDEQSQVVIEDLAARWAQYVASYTNQSQLQEVV